MKPQYYSSLSSFQGFFQTGHPVLTYHHVGPRRRGVRIKGLYVSPELFRRQMQELRGAGFDARPISDAAAGGAGGLISLTFDDGFRDVFENALPVLRQQGFCAIQFLVADLLGKTSTWQEAAGDIAEPLMDESQVREWLAAGHQIGSHTLTHPRLTRLSPAAAREEISSSRKKLQDRFGVTVDHFCYPYGDWNDAVRDLVGEAGYATACTTEFGVNTRTTPPLALKRITARYPSRSWKSIWSRWFGS
ncbi:MAG: polysaccharide deacetylase family protein [Verrucomicrobiota bacterium]